MKIKLSSLCLLIGLSFHINGQSFKKQQDVIFAYNLLTNGVISGLSGALHKKKGEKFLKVFIKNFGKGSLGGFVKYTAKYQSYYLKDVNNTPFAPLNRLLFFAGHSISMNASMNQRSFENLYFNYLGMNFNYQPYAEKGNRFSSRFSMGTLVSSLNFVRLGHRFNFYKSLEYGVAYFDLDPTTELDGLLIEGLGSFNAIAIKERTFSRAERSVIPHEIIHTYQGYDFFTLTSFYRKKQDAFLNKSKVYRIATKYVDFDYQGIFQDLLYTAQPKPRYYKNFFEFEAEHFASRTALRR